MRLLLLSLLFLAACGSDPQPRPLVESIPFRQDGTLTFLHADGPAVTIAIEIADTDSSRTRGLMQRTSLPDRSGMLFIFEEESMQGFWMGNTQLSLDLFFVAADSSIVTIHKYARPLSEATLAPAAPIQYVVETEAGFADTYGIVEGDRIRWRREAPSGG